MVNSLRMHMPLAAHFGFTRTTMQRFFLLMTLVMVLCSSNASAGWLIYHKPSFQGQILDGKTKLPLEGTVVVALYNKRSMGLGAGTLSSVNAIFETVTDKEGKFHIPSYTALIQPFSWSTDVTFTIYKPGYISISDMNLENFFGGQGIATEKHLPWLHDKDLVFSFRPKGIVEMPKPKTREQSIWGLPNIPDPCIRKDGLKILIDLSNSERIRQGLMPEKF